MEYLKETKIICLSKKEFVPTIISEQNYRQLKLRGGIISHGKNKRALIEWESLPERLKRKVVAIYGDPYEYIIDDLKRTNEQKLQNQAQISIKHAAYLAAVEALQAPESESE